jgi:hypothetical protein
MRAVVLPHVDIAKARAAYVTREVVTGLVESLAAELAVKIWFDPVLVAGRLLWGPFLHDVIVNGA